MISLTGTVVGMTEVCDNLDRLRLLFPRQSGPGYPSIKNCAKDQARSVRDILRIIGMRLGSLSGRDGEWCRSGGHQNKEMPVMVLLPEPLARSVHRLSPFGSIGCLLSVNYLLMVRRWMRNEGKGWRVQVLIEPRRRRKEFMREQWAFLPWRDVLKVRGLCIVIIMMIIWVKLCIVCGVESPRIRGLGSPEY